MGSPPDGSNGDRPPGRLRTLLLSAGALGLGLRAAAVGLNVGTVVLLARTLPPDRFGLWVVAYTVVGFGVVVATLGLQKALLRQVAGLVARRQAGAVRASVAVAGLLAVFGALVTGGGLLAGRKLWFGGSLAGVAWILAAWIALQGLALLQAAALRGLHRLIAASACEGFLRSAILLALVAALSATGRVTLPAALGAGALAAGLRLVIGQIVLARRLPIPQTRSDGPPLRSIASKLWHDAWPFLVSSTVSFLTTRADVWLVVFFVRAEETGLYAAATRLVLPVGLPLMALNSTVSSTITRLHTRGRTRSLQKVLRSGATLAALPAAALAAVLLIGRGRLLGALFGPPYSQAGTVLCILTLGHLVRAWTGSCGQTLIMTGRARQQLVVTLLSGVVLLGGSFLAGPVWGMPGVALAAAAAAIVNNLVMLLLTRRTVGLWTHATLSPTAVRKNVVAAAGVLFSSSASRDDPGRPGKG